MAEIFLSYSNKDRQRVQPVRDAFAAQGFDIFWDLQTPPGVDWDTWIRQHLTRAKCAVVFWSQNSVASDNVRHEATVAKQQGKLVPVLLETLTADQFPMGLYSTQAADISSWTGDLESTEWLRLRREVEAKLIPLWVKRTVHELEAELVGERARREAVETRDKALQDQIVKEAKAQIELKRERDAALDDVAVLNARIEEMSRERAELEARAVQLMERLNASEASRIALEQQLSIVQSVESTPRSLEALKSAMNTKKPRKRRDPHARWVSDR
jgi:hypothetical protein